MFFTKEQRADAETVGLKFIEAQEWILDNVYDFADDVPYNVQIEYAQTTYETYRDSLFPKHEEVKN